MQSQLYTLSLILLLFLLSETTNSQNPPLLPDSFQISYQQTYIINSTHHKVNGQVYYDSHKNRQRVDRVNGRYNLFCGGVMANVSTSCTQLVVNDKRYIIYPQKKQCCFCCDSQHGCGILKKNWLEGAKFIGAQKVGDTMCNKWSKDGDFGYNYYWVSTDSNIPRKLDQGGAHITDYLPHTFINKTFDDTYFALPSYCNSSCPATTICGKLREGNLVKYYK